MVQVAWLETFWVVPLDIVAMALSCDVLPSETIRSPWMRSDVTVSWLPPPGPVGESLLHPTTSTARVTAMRALRADLRSMLHLH